MNPKSSLPHLQEPAICPYPEPDQSTPCPHSTSWNPILFLSSNLHLGLPSCLFPSGFPTKTLYAPFLSLIRAASPAHLSLLYLISGIIFGVKYKSLSSSLCSFLHFSVTSSILGLTIQISSSVPYCQTPSAYVPPSTWASKFHTHRNQQAKL